MKRYTVAHLGLGPRGRIHVEGFLGSADRFELVALCDLDEARLNSAAKYGVTAAFRDAEAMLEATRPDVFCFVTQPSVRLAMVEAAIRLGVKCVILEKPMATALHEAWAITRLCREHEVKAVVCHQQKYLTSMEKLMALVTAGELGTVSEIHATTRAWLSQLGTHFMDYVLWINGGARARSVVGHVHGTTMLSDSHPSPDYLLGRIAFENGVRAFIECGEFSPRYKDGDHFWVDNRLTVHGTHGYAWADTDGCWGAFTRSSQGEVLGEAGSPWQRQERERLQGLFLDDLAAWLDNDARVHPCNVELAYHGYEILEAIAVAALDHVRVDLPLPDPANHPDTLGRMRRELPEVPSTEGWRPPGR